MTKLALFTTSSIFNTYIYSGGFNNVFGEDGNDTIYAYCGANTIDAGSGNDVIVIPKSYQTQSHGSDQYHSVYIEEKFQYENGGNFVLAGSGNDSIYAQGEPSQSIAGPTRKTDADRRGANEARATNSRIL